MPTFKQNKSIRGKLSEEDIFNAVHDVLQQKLKVREAARKYNLCHTTISRYVSRIKKGEIDEVNVRKLSMTTKQVCSSSNKLAYILTD